MGELMKLLFTSIIRPRLVYHNIVWHPYLRNDIEKTSGTMQSDQNDSQNGQIPQI